MDELLPVTAPPAHSGFSKGSLSLYVIIIVIGTFVCDKSHSLTITTVVVAMAQWVNCALEDLMVAGSGPLDN